MYPFDPDCKEYTPPDSEIADAIQRVIGDWNSAKPNWDTIFRTLQLIFDDTQIIPLDLANIRQIFAIRQKELIVLLGGRPHTNDNTIASVNWEAEKPALPPLSKNAAAVYELLKALPKHKAMIGSDIIDALGKLKPPINFDYSTLTGRIIPELTPYGVQNIRRIGYFIRNSTDT